MNPSASALHAGRPGHAPPAAAAPRCARCHGAVYRVQRRLADRILSYFVSVQRYRCHSFGCGWEGNLRANGQVPSGTQRKEIRDGR